MWAVNLSSARRQTGTFNAQPGVGTTWRFPGKKKKKSVTYAKDNDKDLPEPFPLDEIPEHLQFSIVAKMKFKDFAEFNVTSKFASEICDILADGVYFEIPTSHMEISELGSSFIEKTSPPMKILMIPPDETLRRIHFACDHLCIRENSLLVYRQHRVTVDKLTLDLSFQDAKVARKILQVVKPKFAQICNANQEMLEMKELHKLSSLHISHSKITFNDVFLNFKMDSLITSGETIIDIPSLIKFIHQWINSTREIKKFQIYTKYFNFSPLIKGLFDNLVFAGTQKNNANGIFLCRHREHRDCLKVIYTTDIFIIMLIKVKTLTGKEIELDIDNTDRVSRLKEKVEEKEGIPPSQQRLIFGGKQMNDDKTCEEYKVTGGCVIHLVLALRGGN